MIKKAYKYRIYPSEEQESLLAKTFGCVRFFWNDFVERFLSHKKDISCPWYPTSTELRKEYEWMKEVSAGALQQKERDCKAYHKQFFSRSRKKKLGRARFRKRSERQSFRLPAQKFTLLNHKIKLEKLGEVAAVIDRRPPKGSRFLSVTVSRTPSGKYYASVLVEQPKPEPLPSTGEATGVDLGLKKFATLADGETVDFPRFFRKNQAKLARRQRILARKTKGSCRYQKLRKTVARLHEKIACHRKHFHHELSKRLVERFDIIAMETLRVSSMIKNRKLAKSIADASWSQFVGFVKYKAEWFGKSAEQIAPTFPSSKMCNVCENIKPNLALWEREWACEHCGTHLDRDGNAAINILRQGVACLTNRMQSDRKTTLPQGSLASCDEAF